MKNEKRRDQKGRILNRGECERKNGTYMYRWTVSGREHCIYARTLSELRQKEKRIQRDADDGIDSISARRITLNDMFQRYMDGKKSLKATTRTNYNYLYKHFVADNIGLRKIDSLKFSDVLRFFNQIAEKANPGTIENLYSVLHPTFQLAVRDGIIRSNPTDAIIGELKNSHGWEKTKRHALTIEEQNAFLTFVRQSDIYSHWLPLFTVFLGTGCRVGEVIGLRWCDCDFEKNVISINHNLIYRPLDGGRTQYYISTPKTAAGCRSIPMLAEVKKALLQTRRQQLAEGACDVEVDGFRDFVFLNKIGRPYNQQVINRAIARIIEAYNEQQQQQAAAEHREAEALLLLPHFTCHVFRHTFATRYCECEDNVKAIQSILGHSNISMTMDIYCEATEAKKKESFSNLEGKIKIS